MKSFRFLAAVAFICGSLASFAQNGTELWSFKGRGAMIGSPALSPDELTVYAATASGFIYALDTAGGEDPEIWNVRIPGGLRSSPMVADDGTLYIGANNGYVYSISPEGEINWRFRTQKSITTSPAIDEDGVIYVGSHDGFLYALAAEDGGFGKAWVYDAGDDIVGSPTIAPDGTIYFTAGLRLIGLNPDGTEAATFEGPKYIATTPAVGEDGTVYFGANNERVYAVDPGAGTNGVRWRFGTGANVLSSPSIGVNGRIYIGSDNGYVHCLTTNGGLIWKFRTGRPVRSSPSIGADGTIYVGSDNRKLYALTPKGEERWSFRSSGAVRSSPAIGSDGTIYFGAGRTFYAIADSAVSDVSPWPMYRRDPQHTARAIGGEPFILEEPESVATNAGATVHFTVVASAAASIDYQWLFNGDEISPLSNPTATNATLVLTNVSITNAGTYSVMITTEFGDVLSEEAVLNVISPPVFTTIPTNHIFSVGSIATLAANADAGVEIPVYQWYTNGVAVPGAQGPTLTITNSAVGSYPYYVVATNSNGGTQSPPATITVVAISLTRAADLIGAGNRFSAGIVTNQLFLWGADETGQLGDGNNQNRNVPTRTSASNDWIAVSAGGVGYTQTSNSAAAHTLALMQNGALYAWGANSRGQLGISSTVDQHIPIRVGSETNWMQVEAGAAHSVGLKSDGTIWTWGANEFGQLGLDSTNNVTSPTQVGIDSAWVEIRAGGSFTLARRADNTVWAWGRNESGQLGINTTNVSRIPVQVGTDTNWTAVRAGASHTLGIRADGTLWTWGRNFGVTSNNISGTTNNTLRNPTQVGTASNWVTISAGFDHSLAIDAGARMYSWGANNVGQLGDGVTAPISGLTNVANRALPFQIATSRGWLDVDAGVKHSLARATDGTIWAWGWNNSGQVGDGTGGDNTEASNRNLPVQLTFTNFASVITNGVGAPVITLQPASATNSSGSNTIFTVVASGAPTLVYQWRFNGTNLALATNAQLTVTGAATNAGAYDVVITNALGSVTSAIAALTFSNSAPVITKDPQSRTANVGGVTGFSVTAAGTSPLAYQWRFNSGTILDATNSTLIITNVQMTNMGIYDVVVSNPFGTNTSMPAALSVTTNTTPGPPSPGSAAALELPPSLGVAATRSNSVSVSISPVTRPYVLEFKNRLEDPEWTPLSTNLGAGTGTNMIDPAIPGASRFYRVRSQ